MKLLLLLLLFPCYLSAQRFIVKDVRPRTSKPINFMLFVGNLDGTIMAVFSLTDSVAPAIRDTLSYNGKDWLWLRKKKFLHLYDKGQFEVLPKAQMKAYNKDSTQWLESLDTAKVKVYHIDSLYIKNPHYHPENGGWFDNLFILSYDTLTSKVRAS